MTATPAGDFRFPCERLPERPCPACGAPTLRSFFASGDAVMLAQCETCAFITNTAAHERDASHATAQAADSCVIQENPWLASWRPGRVDRVQDDLIFCCLRLERVREPLRTLKALRDAAGDTPVMFETADCSRMLAEGAFWQIDPVQCGFFTAASLTRLFQRAGFEVTRIDPSGDTAGPTLLLHAAPEPVGGQKRDMPTLTELRRVTHFARLARRNLTRPLANF